MPIEFDDTAARLLGVCAVQDAEPLLAWLEEDEARRIDAAGLTHPHTAVMQVLLAKARPIAALPEDPAVRAWFEPLLTAQGATIAAAAEEDARAGAPAGEDAPAEELDAEEAAAPEEEAAAQEEATAAPEEAAIA